MTKLESFKIKSLTILKSYKNKEIDLIKKFLDVTIFVIVAKANENKSWCPFWLFCRNLPSLMSYFAFSVLQGPFWNFNWCVQIFFQPSIHVFDSNFGKIDRYLYHRRLYYCRIFDVIFKVAWQRLVWLLAQFC